MYVINGIAYAGTQAEDMRVSAVKPLDDMMMLPSLPVSVACTMQHSFLITPRSNR